MADTALPIPDPTADKPPRLQRRIPLSLRMFVAVLVLLGVMSCLWFCILVKDAREAARRSGCKGGLFYLRFALQNYHEKYGCFPPPYIADADGRPMHSWRVLILPFVDQAAVYNQYRFDEPWDGPNNRELAGKINMWAFHCPSDVPARGEADALSADASRLVLIPTRMSSRNSAGKGLAS